MALKEWLDIAGFTENPFGKFEARKEQDLLIEYFVEPPYFYEILGDPIFPQSSVVFALRGSGKTAQSVMLDYYCSKQVISKGRVLSVNYSDFTAVIEASKRKLEKITVIEHVFEILRRAIVSLYFFILNNPTIINEYHNLSKFKQVDISRYIVAFWKYLDNYQRQYFVKKGIHHKIVKETKNCIPKSWTPQDLLGKFSDYMCEMGFSSIYILIDRLDEDELTASNAAAAVHIVKPLLSDLKLMDLSKVAFKFFLPQEIELELNSVPSIRKDRLIFRNLEWRKNDLLDLLHKRIQAFSRYSNLDEICTPDLHSRIEKEMIECAFDYGDGAPRDIIRLGNHLFSEHSILPRPNSKEEWLITDTAWKNAQKKYISEQCHDINQSKNDLSNDPFFPTIE